MTQKKPQNKFDQECLMAIVTIQLVVLVNASRQYADCTSSLPWGEFGQFPVMGGTVSHMVMTVENSTDVMYRNL